MSDYVYEIVDSTDDERYWTLGIFASLADALAAMNGITPDDLPGDHEEYEGACRVEIRERAMGWGDKGKCVQDYEWRDKYNEDADVYEWQKWKGKP